MMTRNRIAGIGRAVPEHILSNTKLSERVDTSDQWIRERTGIEQRHIAGEGETTCDLATAAAIEAIEDAGLSAQDIDLIVVATTTPDLTFPSTATMVQERLGIHHGAAFDVQAVCSGFVYGMNIVDSLLKTGTGTKALLIGAETFSRLLDWDDRGTCVLFGDGAGAVVISSEQVSDDSAPGILHSYIRSDGRYRDMLYVDGGPSSTGTVGHVRMQGNAVFKHAVNEIAQVIRDCADQADVPIDDINWFVPHQANQRILNAIARKLRIPPETVISTVAQYANTSAASIPMALYEAIRDGRIQPGHLVMIEAFGGGFTWGAGLFRY